MGVTYEAINLRYRDVENFWAAGRFDSTSYFRQKKKFAVIIKLQAQPKKDHQHWNKTKAATSYEENSDTDPNNLD